MNKLRENEGTEVLVCLKELLNDFVLELDQLKQKQFVCQQSVQEYTQKLDQLNSKVDSNHEFFSPGNKTVNLEKEKIELELRMAQLDNENYNNQTDTLVKKIDQINKVTRYITSYTAVEENDEANNHIQDIYGLKILETQESERTRIARDLHDSTVQNLTNLVHKSELCLKLSDIDVIRTKLELQTMIHTIRTTINDMREIIYDLRPMSIDDLGLVVTIERYIKQFMNSNESIHIDFAVENEETKVKPVINITLFRIVQEACNNVIEHANADHIWIHLRYIDSYIQLTIIDNGIGFDKSMVNEACDKSDTSFGLSIMKERAYLLSGKIDIESEENKGTRIFVSVPVFVKGV